MKILITGAAGFIGSHLAEKLTQDDHLVNGLDCLTDYYSVQIKTLNRDLLIEEGVTFQEINLVKDDLTEVLNDIEIIYHLAAQPGISATTPFDLYLRNNIIATQRLLEAAMNSSTLKLFVNISTSSVYGADATGDELTEPRPTSHYGVTKLAAEQLIMAANRDQNFPACSMRLFSVYGPRERPEKLYPKLIASLLNNKEFPLYEGSKNHIRSYTYIDDIITGLTSVLQNLDKCNGEIINIGTDRTITTGEGIKIVEQIIGKSAKILTKPKRPGDQEKTHANIKKAKKLLNYTPETSPGDGLKQEVDWYIKHIHGKIELYP
jgi:nucleoside-diphosphate-sugar epimerase